MTQPTHVWDPGLQPERTSLAWLRLALALLGLGLAAPRFTWPIFGPWAILPTTVVVAAALTLLTAGRRRYLSVHRHLSAGHSGRLPDGRLPLLTVLTALLLAVTALSVVLG